MKEIQKTQEEINPPKKMLNSLQENIEKIKNDISNTKKENATNIDN